MYRAVSRRATATVYFFWDFFKLFNLHVLYKYLILEKNLHLNVSERCGVSTAPAAPHTTLARHSRHSRTDIHHNATHTYSVRLCTATLEVFFLT